MIRWEKRKKPVIGRTIYDQTATALNFDPLGADRSDYAKPIDPRWERCKRDR